MNDRLHGCIQPACNYRDLSHMTEACLRVECFLEDRSWDGKDGLLRAAPMTQIIVRIPDPLYADASAALTCSRGRNERGAQCI